MSEISIIGCGPGGRKSLLTGEAVTAVYRSDILYGSRRLLDLFKDFPGKKAEIKNNYEEILEDIKQSYK